jgi:DNA modification methylase
VVFRENTGRILTHLTPKPLEVFAIPMRQHTRAGDICYEPFSGSGSQIVAGERLGQRVFAMELAPEYVAVALRRYQDATGKRPEVVEE